MNIKPITPFNMKNNLNNNYVIQPRFVQTLRHDSVNFTQSSIKDSIELAHERNMEKYKVYAEVFFDALDSVAKEFEDYGVSFDKKYAHKNPIKSASSLSSKISRSGSFDVPDLIRTTMYIQNPYDTEFIYEKFLPAMENRGYVLAKVNGKPDIDFRLEGLGEVKSSGYEDIQMRFVEKHGSSKNKIKHELIILFGPNYAEAKHNESEKVYNALRAFKELNLDTKDAKMGSHEFKAGRYIDLITIQVENKISKKLFDNAKNKDFYKIDDIAPIYFTDENKKLMKNYFAALKDRIRDAYKIKRAEARNSELATIQLRKDEKDDLALINYIQDLLRSSVKYFEKNQ